MGAPVSERQTIRVSVPGRLELREVAVRAVAAACRLVGGRQTADHTGTDFDLSSSFDAEMVSAFSEVFNNVVMHSYQLRTGRIEIEIDADDSGITVQLTDGGTPFDMSAVPAPELDSMPDHGLGIHIAKSFVDELSYEPGPPNVWRLTKYAGPSASEREVSEIRPPGTDM